MYFILLIKFGLKAKTVKKTFGDPKLAVEMIVEVGCLIVKQLCSHGNSWRTCSRSLLIILASLQ